jgi:glycosyltransferase involved in cell wall biosynthesis
VYKVEPYLRRCVDSILAQTFDDFELILVDDGSPDNCGNICDEYADTDSRVTVIHQDNSGLSAARNAGLRIAKGDCIAFVDSDDCIHEKMYETLYQVIQENDADFVKSNFMTFSDDIPKYQAAHHAVTIYSPEDAMHDFMYTEYSDEKHMKSTVCDVLYRRSMFFDGDNLVLHFPVGKINEDTYLFPELLLRAKKIAHIDIAFYYYFIRQDGITHSSVSLREINSCDLWEHVHAIISPHTRAYEEKLANHSLSRYLNILCRTYSSAFRDPHFYNIRKSMLEDREALIPHITDRRIRRTLVLVRFYPLYRLLKHFFGKYLY